MNYWYLVDCYWKEFKNEEKTPKSQMVLFVLAIISAICALVSIFRNWQITSKLLLFIMMEFMFVAGMVFNAKRLQKNSLKDTLSKAAKKGSKINNWLVENGYKEKNQIKQLSRRLETELKQLKDANDAENQKAEKLFIALYIPVSLSLINYVLQVDGNFTDKLILVILFTVIVSGLYLLYVAVHNEIKWLLEYEQYKMGRMLKDIYLVLDTCYKIENEDFI